MFDERTKVMIGIASSLLIAAVMLITVVFCLYLKISKALKIAKEAHAAEDYYESGKVSRHKNIPIKPILAESCRDLQCFDDYNIYAEVSSLPPCFCGTNEGL
ncbi:protein FAM24A-like [Meriones unguiculatus]|uniref:protein FAM24A-like n=1 Tax=Meriones unguiculatus TaxID=10047 RepID=UPI000B4F3CDC|nr:protein FAM24A-like [Meriones unguiculatus]